MLLYNRCNMRKKRIGPQGVTDFHKRLKNIKQGLPIEKSSEFPNRCMGNCGYYLPLGRHFCDKCRLIKDHAQLTNGKLIFGQGYLVRKKTSFPANRID